MEIEDRFLCGFSGKVADFCMCLYYFCGIVS